MLSCHQAGPRMKNSAATTPSRKTSRFVSGPPGSRRCNASMATARPTAPQRLTMESAISDGVMARLRGAAAGCRRLAVVHPVRGRKHQPLQRKHGGSGEQRRDEPDGTSLKVAPRGGEIDAADLQQIVAPRNPVRGRKRRCTARRDALARRRRIFSARRSRRYRHPVMTKRASSKPASSPTPNTARCRRMMPRASCRWQNCAARPPAATGNTSEKVSHTMPQTAGTCVTLEIHFGRKPPRMNSTSVVRPYSTQDSPCPCTSGSTITRPRWVTSVASPSSSTGITDTR